eukprot:356138-Chlamydomonas_euryale.AAC.3
MNPTCQREQLPRRHSCPSGECRDATAGVFWARVGEWPGRRGAGEHGGAMPPRARPGVPTRRAGDWVGRASRGRARCHRCHPQANPPVRVAWERTAQLLPSLQSSSPIQTVDSLLSQDLPPLGIPDSRLASPSHISKGSCSFGPQGTLICAFAQAPF